MKNLFRKTRVVHILEEQLFEVQLKRGWFSPWNYVNEYKYHIGDKRPTSSYEAWDNEEEARDRAIKYAKKLANKTIEWESK